MVEKTGLRRARHEQRGITGRLIELVVLLVGSFAALRLMSPRLFPTATEDAQDTRGPEPSRLLRSLQLQPNPHTAQKIALPRARHEQRDIDGRFIVLAFLMLVASLGGLGLLSWALFPGAARDFSIPDPSRLFPSPQLQPDPHQDWERFHAQELERLNSAGWVNKADGIVHIPIDQAMHELAWKGIPGWPAAGQP
jgi:hypothetical protein